MKKRRVRKWSKQTRHRRNNSNRNTTNWLWRWKHSTSYQSKLRSSKRKISGAISSKQNRSMRTMKRVIWSLLNGTQTLRISSLTCKTDSSKENRKEFSYRAAETLSSQKSSSLYSTRLMSQAMTLCRKSLKKWTKEACRVSLTRRWTFWIWHMLMLAMILLLTREVSMRYALTLTLSPNKSTLSISPSKLECLMQLLVESS